MPMNYPSQPEMKVEIAFVDNPLGDDPEGDAQVSIGGAINLPTGWTDITNYTREVSIDRGRSSDLEKVATGTASVLLDNRDRRFDPINQSSPYWDSGSVVTRTNLLRNPSFQYGIGNWFYSNATAAVGLYQGFLGDNRLVVTVASSGAPFYMYASNYSDATGTTTSRTAVTAGQAYRMSIYFRDFIIPRDVIVGIAFFNAAGAMISNNSSTYPGLGGYSQFDRVDRASVAPAGAVSAVPYVGINSVSMNDEFEFACALFEKATTLGAYFDGDQPACRWKGTPGDSQSEQTSEKVNLFQNPSFESGDTFGVFNYNATMTASTDRAFLGDYSLKCEVAGDYYTDIYAGWAYTYEHYIPILDNDDVSYSFWVYSEGTEVDVFISLDFWDAGGNSYGTSGWVFEQTVPADKWTRISGSYAVPGGAYVSLIIDYDWIAFGGVGNYTIYTDAIMIHPSIVVQPYIDGDMAGFEWHGTKQASASQGLIRSAGTLLKPRRQIQIHAVFPNDVIQDNFCYDLTTGLTMTPSVGAGFTRSGLNVGPTVTTFTNNGFLSSTHIAVLALIRPKYSDWYASEQLIWRIPNVAALSIQSGELRVWLYFAGGWNLERSDPLPADKRFDSQDFKWLKVDLEREPFGGGGQYRIRVNMSYCNFQTSVPSLLTTLGVESISAASTLMPQLVANSIQFGGSTTTATGAPLPESDPNTNQFFMARFAIDDVDTDTRILDLLADTYHTIFRGYTAGWRQQYDMTGKDATVPLECFDALGVLGNMKSPTDFLAEFLEDKEVWGWWKLGDAGGVAVDYSGNAHDLTYKDGGRLPSKNGYLAAGLSGLATDFEPTRGSGNLIANDVSGDVYPATQTYTGFTISMWLLSTQELANASDKHTLLFMRDQALVDPTNTNPTWGTLDIHLTNRVYSAGKYLSYGGVSIYDPGGPGITNIGFTGGFTDLLNNGQPRMVTLTYDISDNRLRWYVDGQIAYISVPLGFGPYIGGKMSIGGRWSSYSTSLGYRGDIQDVIISPTRTFTAAEVQELFELSEGYIIESTGDRAQRLLDYVEYPDYLRGIDTDTYGEVGYLNVREDQSMLEMLHQIEDTEVGVLFADRTGRIAMLGRYYLSMSDPGVNAQAEFNDLGTAIGFRDLSFNLDAEELANDTTVVDQSEQEYQSQDIDSVANYGRRSRRVETLLTDSEDARQMAIGLTNIYREPILRAEPFGITPAGEQWLTVLPLDLGMRMSLNVTPMGVGDAIEQDVALQQISYQIRPKDWQVTITGSPRPVVSYFVLDRSFLDGPDVLGF